jgi:DNA mismatch repair protein MutS
MPFQSILFEQAADPTGPDGPAASPVLADLNLDQVCASMMYGRDQYDLTPYFLAPLSDESAINYRHQVFRDLRDDEVRAAVTAFTRGMVVMRQGLDQAGRLPHPHQRQRWFLDAADTYTGAVQAFAQQLQQVQVSSSGLRYLREYLQTYLRSSGYQQLTADVRDLLDRLAEVRYSLQIRGTRVRVTRYEGEADFGAEVERTFAKFQQGAVEDHRLRSRSLAEMNQVEGLILDHVAELFPELFGDLDEFCRRQASYVDDLVGTFDREIQFYLAYLDYIRPLESAGLPFCFPHVSTTDKRTSADGSFDLALARKLTIDGKIVVTNSLELSGPERAIVVTGPNQGGKTTFARMFGQLHYLASLGLPVPGRSARLFVPDRIFTHFEKEENLSDLRSNLEDELVRMHEILAAATSRSVIVMNESFASTTLADASFLGAEILGRITAHDQLCLYVTFIDGLSSLNPACVSMVAEIVPDNPADRTFRIVRRPADGQAYAAAIADKYGLSYERLRERLKERLAG